MKIEEEGMSFFISNQEDSFLSLRAFDLVILDDELFLQDLNSIELFGSLCLCKHDFTEVTFTKDSKKVEVLQANASLLLLDLLSGLFAGGLLGFGNDVR